MDMCYKNVALLGSSWSEPRLRMRVLSQASSKWPFTRAGLDVYCASGRQIGVIERAERLGELQAYGAERSAEAGLSPDDAVAIVRQALKPC
jgi:hypothetical protein